MSVRGAYVWRAAIIAAAFNLLLNPGIAWVTKQEWGFIPTIGVGAYVAVISMLLGLVVSVMGARRLRREVAAHEAPHGGTAWERQLLARLPSSPALFGALVGLTATVAALVVFTVMGALGFSGFSLATFSVVMAVYGGALAFVTMRWTILRQLMELTTVR